MATLWSTSYKLHQQFTLVLAQILTQFVKFLTPKFIMLLCIQMMGNGTKSGYQQVKRVGYKHLKSFLFHHKLQITSTVVFVECFLVRETAVSFTCFYHSSLMPLHSL